MITALQFITTFRSAKVHFVGSEGPICWMAVEVDIDGTEPQQLFIMEADNGDTRAIVNRNVGEPSRTLWQHPSAVDIKELLG
jgi:hypothetical protein